MGLFGTSGIRRLANRELIDLAFQVGLAVGNIYSNIVIGRDTRTSGSVLNHAVTTGVLAVGARCTDVGVLPTPTLAFAAREFEAAIMITASHNPPQYNGLKMLNPDGSAFSYEQQKQIEDLISCSADIQTSWDKMQSEMVCTHAIENHILRIMQDFPAGTGKGIKVVVDSGCGAAYFITPQLLTRLGCQVIPLNCYPNGIFPHEIEPIEANLKDLMRAVKETGANLGIAHDGDADRMMVVDDLGRFISGDKLLAIFSQASGVKNIVTTIDASMCIEEMGFVVRRTRVGDPYVSEELKKSGGFGGEPSGSWIFPLVSFCPDGIYAAAQIIAVASRQKLSILADSIPSYPVVRGNVSGISAAMGKIQQELMQGLKPVSIDTIDGLKLIFKDGWLLVRPSGTEPKIRLTTESKSKDIAQGYYEKGKQIIAECVS
jgi:phosphoglucosamine mutase